MRHIVTRFAIAVLMLIAGPVDATAQRTAKVYRIGITWTAASSEAGHLIKALDERLRELGYVEGRNIRDSSGDLRREGKSDSALSPRSLSVSRSTSSWRGRTQWSPRSSKRRPRSRS